MVTFTESFHCKSRLHCQACRHDAAFRASLLRAGLVSERDFSCPAGFALGQTEGLPNPKSGIRIPKSPLGLGDIVEAMAKPIAKALKLDCLDAQNNLKPQSPCARRRDLLNRIQL